LPFARLVLFSHWLIIDRGCGTLEALRGSWFLSRGHFWGLFGILLLVLGGLSVVSVLTLGIGVVLALPAAVLVLNAGYLLVAGADPLPGGERQALIVPSRRCSLVASWAPTAAVAVLVLANGAWSGLAAHAERRNIEREIARRNLEMQRARARQAVEEARQREEEDRLSESLVAYFREGGWWSFRVSSHLDEEASGKSLAETTHAAAAGDIGVLPGGATGGFGQAGSAAAPPRYQVVVLGPPDLLSRKPERKLGVPAERGGQGSGSEQTLRDWYGTRLEWQREFFRRFADALARDEVAAVLVEVVVAPRLGSDASAPGLIGGVNGPGAAGAAGAIGPADETGGGAATSGTSAYGLAGLPIKLDNAVPLSRERLLELVDR
jgi:hypothetical protein